MSGSQKLLEEACRGILSEIGEDPNREGLIRTPHRFAKSLLDLTAGYSIDVKDILNGAIFTEQYSQMVVVKRIDFFSLCEHHLLPFFGHVHVGYLPNGKIIGLSKIPRIVNLFARRLQVQERLTEQIASCLQEVLAPKGVGCIVEAYHLCSMMRGVQAQGTAMVTSAMLGQFRESAVTRDEFLEFVNTEAKLL